MDKLYDAVVVGAGPAGNYVAYKLAGYGYRVLVLERNERIGQKACCTGIIGKECFERFPVARNAVLTGIESIKVFSPMEQVLELRKGETLAYVVDREGFDSALARSAQEKGAEYSMSSRVVDITLDNQCVKVHIEHVGGMDCRNGKVVILCSGFGGPLPKKIGLGRVGDFALGAQKEVGIDGIDEVEVYFNQNIAPGFFAWAVPVSSGRARIGLLTRKNPGRYLDKLISKMSVRGRVSKDNNEVTYGGIPLLPLQKTCKERLLVVGDAAGHVKPTTGGGIYYGLICADIAADTVNKALALNDLSAKRLSAYDASWKKTLANELRLGYIARRIYENLNNEQIEQILRLVKENDFHNEVLNSPNFSFDWHGEHILGAVKHRIMGGTLKSITRARFPF